MEYIGETKSEHRAKGAKTGVKQNDPNSTPKGPKTATQRFFPTE
jgi:hypothetical protein